MAIQPHDLVAALRDHPEVGVQRGWIGVALLQLAPGMWEVEFADDQGRSIATVAMAEDELLELATPVAAE